MTGVQPQGEAELRGDARSNMFLAAVLQGAGFSGPVKVRNMSPAGALVEAASLPDTGASVQLLRGSLSVGAVVAWSAPGRCGLSFSSLVVVREWLAPPCNASQQRVDDAVRILKLGAVPLNTPSTDSTNRPERTTLEALGRDLERAARLVESLGNDLAADEKVLARHLDKLQNVDLALQLISVVAETLICGGDGSTAARLKNLRASSVEATAR